MRVRGEFIIDDRIILRSDFSGGVATAAGDTYDSIRSQIAAPLGVISQVKLVIQALALR